MDQPNPSSSDASTLPDRRGFARLHGTFQVRYGVCGAHGPQVPGFTQDMGIGGIRFTVSSTDVTVGDHLAVEIVVPGHEDPLYFLGQVLRVDQSDAGAEIGLRFDFLGKSENYKELLEQLVRDHGGK